MHSCLSDDDSILSTSSSDEETENTPRLFRPLRDRLNLFEMYDDAEFKTRFRFEKKTIIWLCDLIGPEIQPSTKRRKSISAMNQILLTMRFLATGAFQQLIGDSIFVHKSTTCVIIKRVVHKIAELKPHFIKMPTDKEIETVKSKFYRLKKMPGVIGAIDCTHIPIKSPGKKNGELFRNRKSGFSINVQIVCDADLKIRNVVARWHGSAHDSTIFNNSSLSTELERGYYGDGYLLGDSGYACSKYLLTPLLNPKTPAEEKYNISHKSTRNTIERCFGVLKRRFPCLQIGLRNQMETSLTIIVACCVLHNIAIFTKENEPPIDRSIVVRDQTDQNLEDSEEIGNYNENGAVRRKVIKTHFS